MSNIGKKTITVGEGVQIDIQENLVKVIGPKGTLETSLPRGLTVVLEDGRLKVQKSEKSPAGDDYFGLVRSLLANSIEGVTKGFEKKLELVGVGFRARVDGRDLVLNVGFATPVRIVPPEGVTFTVVENVISVQGIDKQVIGDIAHKIREVKKPDPYKGKGIRYLGERLRKKAGKAAKAAGAAA